MFSLIISIISIALVSSLALASIYYGGKAMAGATVDTEASKILSQGQQIQTAITLRNLNADTNITTISGLAPKYLKQNPELNGTFWNEPNSEGYISRSASSKEICDTLNTRADIETTPIPTTPTKYFGCISTIENIYTAYFLTGSFE